MITKQFLEDLERMIRKLKRALKKEGSVKKGDKLKIDVPHIDKQIEYTITQEDIQTLKDDLSKKKKDLKDKFKEAD